MQARNRERNRNRKRKLAVEVLETRCLMAGLTAVQPESIPVRPIVIGEPVPLPNNPTETAPPVRPIVFGDPVPLGAPPVVVASEIPAGLQGKISHAFWEGLQEIEAVISYKQTHPMSWPLSQVTLQKAFQAQLNDAGEVLVQFDFDELNDATIETLQQHGVRIEGVIHPYGRVVGWVHGLDVRAVGQLPEIARLDFPLRAMNRWDMHDLPVSHVVHALPATTDLFVASAASVAGQDPRLYMLGREESIARPPVNEESVDTSLWDSFDNVEREVDVLATEPAREQEWQYLDASMAINAPHELTLALQSVLDLNSELLFGAEAVLTVGLSHFANRGLNSAS